MLATPEGSVITESNGDISGGGIWHRPWSMCRSPTDRSVEQKNRRNAQRGEKNRICLNSESSSLSELSDVWEGVLGRRLIFWVCTSPWTSVDVGIHHFWLILAGPDSLSQQAVCPAAQLLSCVCVYLDQRCRGQGGFLTQKLAPFTSTRPTGLGSRSGCLSDLLFSHPEALSPWTEAWGSSACSQQTLKRLPFTGTLLHHFWGGQLAASLSL